ncbi:copper homeostasis protein CutC [Dactylosporangium vinaceum]|uniref:Copper homeostasis protein cutC homolog n=1 Tax=Dactylosporangium vinaceum TaxID=53362 RepID=A0ABV5M1S7_9ACTN|nr:copper homeostasis protein CutC [Dactylosporangium vinaceum]
MLVEIIALDAADARAAQDGGADRVELVSDMAAGGLSPAPAVVESVLAAVSIPVRVMVRTTPDFTARVPAVLRRLRELRAAGATEFVLGFLTPAGAVDPAVVDALDGAPWTFHRAIDHAADRAAAWPRLAGLPGLTSVLTAGAPTGMADGLPVLLAEAPAHAGLMLAGGGLRESHLAPLTAAGVRAFHSGSAVRPGGRWTAPVSVDLVRRLRQALGPATPSTLPSGS